MAHVVIGWCDSYTRKYQTAPFTKERKQALVERIRKRRYNFQHFYHQFMPFAAPYYDDGVICVLTKPQWDDVMTMAYKDSPLGPRLMPQDVITRPPKNDVLFEKEKYEVKGDDSDG